MADAGLFRRLVPREGAAIPFTIDGEPAEAREGDLLLTAILLHRSALRRFEFGDADRAGFCLMAACQDCWVSSRRRAPRAGLHDPGRSRHGDRDKRNSSWLIRSSSSARGQPVCVRSKRSCAVACGRSSIDEAERPGGQIYRQPPPGAARPAEALYGFEANKAIALHAILSRLGDAVDYRPGTLVWNVFGKHLDTLGPGGHGGLDFDRLVIASGAMDRVLPFPGWTLPGVFTLGGAQIALKAQGVAIGRRVAFVGAGPLLPLVAHQYVKAGAEVVAVLDLTPFAAKLKQAPGLLAEAGTLAKGLWYMLRNRRCGLDHSLRRSRVRRGR